MVHRARIASEEPRNGLPRDVAKKWAPRSGPLVPKHLRRAVPGSTTGGAAGEAPTIGGELDAEKVGDIVEVSLRNVSMRMRHG